MSENLFDELRSLRGLETYLQYNRDEIPDSIEGKGELGIIPFYLSNLVLYK